MSQFFTETSKKLLGYTVPGELPDDESCEFDSAMRLILKGCAALEEVLQDGPHKKAAMTLLEDGYRMAIKSNASSLAAKLDS